MNRVLASGALLATAAFAQEQGQIKIIHSEVEHGNVMYRAQADAPGNKTMSVMSDVVMTRFMFDGKTVKGAPYSAEATTESTQVLPDGNRITHKNTSTLYRDGQGRTRREETINAVGPWSSNEPLQSISINDPVAGMSYSLDTKSKTARKMTMPMLTGPAGSTGETRIFVRTIDSSGPMPPPPAGEGTFNFHVAGPATKDNAKTEQLGKQTIEGVVCEGTRTTITIPAGQIGNERPIDVVNERWYSPELQVVVLSKNSDPRMGETVYKLANIQRAEPLPSLFQVPSDYTVKTEEMPKIRTIMRKEKEQ